MIEIPISKFYLIQNIGSSFSFWLILGVSLISNFNYFVIPCIFCVIAATFYNPMFYQVSRGNVLKSKQSCKLFKIFYIIGCIIGYVVKSLFIIQLFVLLCSYWGFRC